MNKYVCAECGKEFVVPGFMKYYNYKLMIQNKITYYCSYNCQQAAERKLKKKNDSDNSD